MYDLKHWHGQNLHHHKQLYQAAAATGYECVTLTQYGTPDSPVYAAVMIKRANNPEQRPFFAQSLPGSRCSSKSPTNTDRCTSPTLRKVEAARRSRSARPSAKPGYQH